MTDGQRSAPARSASIQAIDPLSDRPPLYSAWAMREIDRLAVERYGILSIVLMENAARSIALAILGDYPRSPLSPADRHVTIVCGPGNNGGDGFALARHVHNAHFSITLVSLVPLDRLPPDAATNARIAERMGLTTVLAPVNPESALNSISSANLIVDALFGIGLSRPLTGPAADLVNAINRAHDLGTAVIAVDLPSGLDADSGLPVGGPDSPCVRADLTVTLAGIKRGCANPASRLYTGSLALGDIGVPCDLLNEFAGH